MAVRRPATVVLATLSLLGTGCSTPHSASTPGPSTALSASTDSTRATPTTVPRTPVGFELVAATVQRNGRTVDTCMWLADDPALRNKGLMDVTNLGAGDAMVFVYDQPTSTTFWMKNTLLPLSIAFYDAAGTHLGAFDMEPCHTDACPTYPTAQQFTYAVEAVQQSDTAARIGPGSRLSLDTSSSCSTTPDTD